MCQNKQRKTSLPASHHHHYHHPPTRQRDFCFSPRSPCRPLESPPSCHVPACLNQKQKQILSCGIPVMMIIEIRKVLDIAFRKYILCNLHAQSCQTVSTRKTDKSCLKIRTRRLLQSRQSLPTHDER